MATNKNVYLFPSEKGYIKLHGSILSNDIFIRNYPKTYPQDIYVTTAETICTDDWYLNTQFQTIKKATPEFIEGLKFIVSGFREQYKKIVLTTNTELIADGIQELQSDFIGWYINKYNDSGVGIDIVDVRHKTNTPLTCHPFECDCTGYSISIDDLCTCIVKGDNVCDFCNNQESLQILSDAKASAKQQDYSSKAVRLFMGYDQDRYDGDDWARHDAFLAGFESRDGYKDESFWKGFDYALALLDELYSKQHPHPFNIADCIKAKVNRLPKEEIRKN